MGNYQRLLSDPMEQAQANFAHAPFGIPSEIWTDLSENGAKRRAAHFVLSQFDVYTDPDMVVEEASILFGARPTDITEHIREVAKL